MTGTGQKQNRLSFLSFLANIKLKATDVCRSLSQNSLARGQGFEPRLAGPEPAVLPLDDPRIFYSHHLTTLPPKISNTSLTILPPSFSFLSLTTAIFLLPEIKLSPTPDRAEPLISNFSLITDSMVRGRP